MSLAQKVRDVTDVVGSLSDVAGPSAWAKKIKIDSSSPKVTKERAIFLCHHEYASSLSCYPIFIQQKIATESCERSCTETMSDAAKEIIELKGTDADEIVDCGVFCDGTWQRRGYQSLNRSVTAISMDTGKVVDVEPLSSAEVLRIPLNSFSFP